jgi:hypothetical protein
MTRIILLLIGIMTWSLTSGQDINQKKMDKDLEVARNVLGSMIDKQGGLNLFPRTNDIESKYAPGVGVVFSVNNRFLSWGNGQYAIAYGERTRVAKGSSVTVTGRNKKNEDASAPEAYFLQEGEAQKEQLSEVFKDFLKNYSTLIRQLKPDEKIIIKTINRKRGFGNIVIAGLSSRSVRSINSITVEALKRDLDDYEEGKLTEEQINDKILVRESSTDLEKEPEIEVFSSVLGRLYQADLSDTYYMSGTPYYERTDGMGLTYYLKFYSSMEGEGTFFLPTVQKSDLNLEERNKVVNDMYPEFLEEIKINILDYGHILKNLDGNETIIFNIELTECEGCDMPEEIDVSVKKSVIDQYRKDQLSLNQATDRVKVSIVK